MNEEITKSFREIPSCPELVGHLHKDVTIEYSTNGTNYTTLGTTHEFVRAPGAVDYAHNTTVDFGSAPAKYVRLTANRSSPDKNIFCNFQKKYN